MKKIEVKIGGTYVAKVSDRLTEVRIDRVSEHGGWDATNVTTGKSVRIKSPARLRRAVKKGKSAEAAPATVEDLHRQAAAEADGTKAKKAAKAKGEKAPKADGKMSCLDAAAKVLGETGQPMTTREMVDAMVAKGYWKSDAPTPHNTLYSAILREVQKKGDASRFKKADRGKFALNA